MQTLTDRFTTSIHTELPYLLYLPNDYDATDAAQAYPFILTLHGTGERGHDLVNIRNQGLPRKLESGDELPFIVLAPQCPEGHWWMSYHHSLMSMLDMILERYNIDETRLYLSGFSMGGFGTWHLATDYPQRFAAIAPICGFANRMFGYPERLRRIVHLPVWAFHGEDDQVVAIEETETLVDALKDYGASVTFTRYLGVEHDAWTPTYDDPALYEWFLRHKS